MTAYNESTISGDQTSWDRARQLVLDNPIDSPPSVTCFTQTATRLPDGSVLERGGGSINYTMTDPETEIPFIDENYEPTATTFKASDFAAMAASVALWMMRGQS